MIKIVPALVISSTLSAVDYSPKPKYVIDGDYADTIRQYYPQLIKDDPLTDILYQTLIQEIDKGYHEQTLDSREE
jgi:hypothetical protein